MKKSANTFLLHAFFMLCFLALMPQHIVAQNEKVPVVQQAPEFTVHVNGQDFTIQFSQIPKTAYTVEVYEITGKQVGSWSQKQSDEAEVIFTTTKSLHTGLYLIRLSAGTHVILKKFLI
jgi:hypothetical protein